MQSEQFDLALQMHGGGQESNPFVSRLGARLTAGMRAVETPPLDRWFPYVYWQHEVIRFLEVASLVGAPAVGIRPLLTVTASDTAATRQLATDDDRPIVVMRPGANDPRRRWPPPRFAAVGDALVAEGARVVVVGATEDEHLAAKVVSGMAAPAENLAGRTSLGALLGLMTRGDLRGQ